MVRSHFSLNEFAGAHLLGSFLKRATGDLKDSEGNVHMFTVCAWFPLLGRIADYVTFRECEITYNMRSNWLRWCPIHTADADVTQLSSWVASQRRRCVLNLMSCPSQSMNPWVINGVFWVQMATTFLQVYDRKFVLNFKLASGPTLVWNFKQNFRS